MSSIHGKNTLSFRREKTSESSSTPIITKDIKFAHEASAGETSINLTALNLPSNLINFSNPTGTQLDAINLKANDSNLVLVSSLRGTLQLGLSYYVSTRDKITLTFAAAEGEIFTGHVRLTQATANVVDAQSFQITGTLTAGNTDIALGKAFNLNANPTTQIGEVILYINGVQQFRNVGNATAAPAADGNYEEVDAGNGKTNLLRINQALGADVPYAVVSNGLIVEQDCDGHQQQIDSLAGQIDAMIPTVANLAGVPETNFQAGPNSVDLKAFADKLYSTSETANTNETDIATANSRLDNYVPVTVQKSLSSGNYVAGGTFAQITNQSLSVIAKNNETVTITFEGEAGADGNGWFTRQSSAAPSNTHIEVRIMRNGVEVARYPIRHQDNAPTDHFIYIPASSVSFTETLSAGTYTYTAEMVMRSGIDAGARRIIMVSKKHNIIS